jgi:hypothetical protein
MIGMFRTYDASSRTNSVRKRGEDIHYRVDPLHQPLIAIPKLLKRLGLALKYGFGCIDRVTLLQLGSKLIVEKWFSGLLLIFAQSTVQASIED